VTEPTLAQRLEHRRLDEVHPCFRPDCGQRAETAFHIDDEFALAGRWWRRGEWLDLCAADADEMRRVATEVEDSGYRTFDGVWLVEPDRMPLEQLWV